jgi:hypothetical protein
MFSLALWLCSAGVVQKYLGTAAALLYAPICVVSEYGTRALLRQRGRIPERLALIAIVAAGVVAAVALIVAYPHANAHSATAGSDRDDAATIGARHLLDGEYPYTERTYLGNPISQFPGGILAATPFVAATGSAGYENVLWVPALLVLFAWLAGSFSAAALLLLVMFGVSPGLWRELLTGGDLIPTVTAVCACLAVMSRAWAWPLLGAALCWRPNLAVSALPFLWRLGLPRALAAAGTAAATFAILTLPFALHGGFTPWGAGNKLESYNAAFPGGAWIVLAAGTVLAALLAWRNVGTVWTQAAAPQAFYLGAFVLKACVDAHRLDLTPLVSGYGALVLVPAALALVARPTVANINRP